MNADKAKEFFSAYYEGSLDRGLRQSLDRRFESDPALLADYRAFEQAMEQLKGLDAPVPEPSFDLHERIVAKLDKHIHDSKHAPQAGFFARRRPLLIAGLCVVALVGAVLQIGSHGNRSLADLLGLGRPTEQKIADLFKVANKQGEPTLSFLTGGKKTVTIRMAATGEILRQVELDGTSQPAGTRMHSPLTNKSPNPALLQIDISDSRAPQYVALPGTASTMPSSGRGTVRELALALADRYRVVVVVAGAGARTTAWELKDDAVASATEALKGTSYSVDQRSPGVIWIQ